MSAWRDVASIATKMASKMHPTTMVVIVSGFLHDGGCGVNQPEDEKGHAGGRREGAGDVHPSPTSFGFSDHERCGGHDQQPDRHVHKRHPAPPERAGQGTP